MRWVHTGVIACWLSFVGAPAEAQTPSGARLIVTVIDPSGARVPQAAVIILEINGVTLPTPRTYVGPAGRIVADDLVPGVYGLRVDAAGFAPVFMRSLPVSGDVRRTVRLAVHRVAETVVVEADGQQAALDPRGFSTLLTREQIDALPDDPAEMAAVLRDLAPPGAVIRIDGFPGGLVPPKSQILSIRLPRLDTYAAQEHGGLSALSFIEIVTAPGGGRVRGTTEVSWRPQALNARHPLTHAAPADSARTAAVAIDGPLVPDAASFAVAIRRGILDVTEPVRAVDASGASLTDDPVRTQAWTSVSARLVASLPGGQIARVSVASDRRTTHNAGVGGLNLRDRAYGLGTAEWAVRAVSGGRIGRRVSLESRLELRWAGQRAVSLVEQPTIRVLEAFHAGGAQMAGGERTFDLAGAADLEYGRGVHAVRTGVLLERHRLASSRRLNYLGTYTFPSLNAFIAGQPATYTRRVGTPDSELANVQLAVYAQDDVRVRRDVLIGYGVRYERQSLVDGRGRLLPRASLAWSPSPRGTTTVRTGAGLFSEWMAAEVAHQGRLLDGERQYDILMYSPAYPVTDESQAEVRRERYGLAPGLDLPLVAAGSIAVEQYVGPLVRVHAGYSARSAWHLLRGLDTNAPVSGHRPDPTRGSVVHATSDARMRTRTFTLQASSVGAARRASVIAAYVHTNARSNTAGPFVVPPSGRIDGEWGPTAPRHIFTATASVRAFAGISLAVTPRWRTGFPYSITSGIDDNQDGLFTDRPPGTPRHSERTPSQFDLGTRLSFAAGFGGESETTGVADVVPETATSRYRIEAFVAAHNVTNRPAYTAIGSIVGSPAFGRPLAALEPRRLDVGVRLAF